ncbi:hypothetical protein [uncultured Croceicoccus sp.]|uniref:hypothetical protein n=1 Tax=uncultured Croceicoccus sp. TaxID=1295329 RepID=UPI00261728BF|nr:hypothetical protein [uncultured Croceicoccus sp.]
MWQLIEANWVAFLIVAILAVLIAFWIVGRAKKPRERSHRPDVLDEGVGPARRNQALIDAPPAGAPPVSPSQDTIGGNAGERLARQDGASDTEKTPPATPPLGGADVAVAAAVLSNEPGTDEDIATDHRATAIQPGAADDHRAPPAAETADHTFEPNDQAISDRETVAAAAKMQDEDDAAHDLSRIKGVGPKLIAMLGSMGISRYDQIAAWTDEDVAKIDAQMGNFQGRIERDNWREQARLLSEGDREAYEAKFGKL